MNLRALLYPDPSRLMPLGLLIVRATTGLFMAAHGFMKLSAGLGGFAGALERMGFPLPGLFAACAAFAELGGGLLVAIGLLTRPAAAVVSFTMIVAWVTAHLGDLPKIGGPGGSAFEYPFLLSMVALAIAIVGPGAYSLDARLFGSAPARTPDSPPS